MSFMCLLYNGVARKPERPTIKGNTSGYRGVFWNKVRGRWQAAIWHEQRRRHIGYFEDRADAARAYDARAKVLKGSRAKLNFPEST